MPAEFTVISHEDMDGFLWGLGYEHTVHPAYEYVYEKTIHRYIYRTGGFRTVVRVYSSVDIRTEVTRDKGKDAIRVVPLIIPGEHMREEHGMKEAYPFRKEKRVHRVKNWKANLEKRLDAVEIIPIKKSPAGWPMIVKNGRNGPFWSSLAWPREKYTETYRA